MSSQRAVTVVDILSPSYSGTTWLCLLLGSHLRAFALGPPDRVWSRRKEGCDDACRVHGKECPFWEGFFERYDPDASFYVQLAAASGRDVIVINNPTPAHRAAELEHPDLVVRPVQFVRDGRALACSNARHHRIDFIDAVRHKVRPIYDAIPFDTDREDVLAVRYEDLCADQCVHLARFGAYLGLDYPETATRFWEFEHHITSGNAGAIALLKLFQGLDVPDFRHRAFYHEQYERMKAGEGMFLDERWKRELGRRELFVFDQYCGASNASWGYEEDAFTTREREAFLAELSTDLYPVRAAVGERTQWWIRSARARLGELRGRIRRSQRQPLNVALLAVALVAWFLSLAVTVLISWLVFRG